METECGLHDHSGVQIRLHWRAASDSHPRASQRKLRVVSTGGVRRGDPRGAAQEPLHTGNLSLLQRRSGRRRELG